MARVTVEDCVTKIPNRFDLVVLAAQRSRLIASGSPIAVSRDNDKNPVVSLREIATGAFTHDSLLNSVLQNFRQVLDRKDQAEEEELDNLLLQDRASRRRSIEIGGSSSKEKEEAVSDTKK